jgi:hypothetical protein
MKIGDKVKIIEVHKLNPESMQKTIGYVGTIVKVIPNGVCGSKESYDSYLVQFEDAALGQFGWEYEANELEAVIQ